MDKVTLSFFLPEKLICLFWGFKVEERNMNGYLISTFLYQIKQEVIHIAEKAMYKPDELKANILV